MRASRSALAAVLLMTSGAASAAETITYSYDARGRLVQLSRAGGVSSGAVTRYAFDRADNRTSKSTTGSPFNYPASRAVVIPLRRGSLIAF